MRSHSWHIGELKKRLSNVYIIISFLFTKCICIERDKVWKGYNKMLSCDLSFGDRLHNILIFFLLCVFSNFSTMKRNHIYNNLKSYKSELCRLEFSTNMGLQLGLCHCQGKRRNQLFGFTHDAGETAAKGSICVWVWPLRPVPGNLIITHAHVLSILFPVWLRCCSEDAYFTQEKFESKKIFFFLLTYTTYLHQYLSHLFWESAPHYFPNFHQLPIIYKFFGLASRVLWGLPPAYFPSHLSLKWVALR